MKVNTIQNLIESNKNPEILFWVGCAGAFDERYKKVTKAFVKILNKLEVNYAVLGKEEGCTGDPARRAGNEYLFQMQALNNISTLNQYNIKKIVTTCPHCFNTLKNEYPELGGNYNVIHHTEFLNELLDKGKLITKKTNQKITYHDSCYLGRGNKIYEAPRSIINSISKMGTTVDTAKIMALLIAPFAPFIAESIWQSLGQTGSVHQQAWPIFDPALVIDDEVTIVVQVNGKVRDRIMASRDVNESDLTATALAQDSVKKYVDNKEIVKTIVVPQRLINFVVK